MFKGMYISLNYRMIKDHKSKNLYNAKLIVNNNSTLLMGFPGGSVVKNLPANAEDWGSILGQEDILEKEMATHFSILVWEIPWTEEPGGL